MKVVWLVVALALMAPSALALHEPICDEYCPPDPLGWLFGWFDISPYDNNTWHPQPVEHPEKSARQMGGMVMMEAAMSDTIGVTVGGAQDAGNFRANVEGGYLPLATDITPEGLFSEYYFDTNQTGSCDELFCPSYSKAVTPDPVSGQYEAWLSVGLNSGLSVDDFERPDLDLVIVLDVSGSMSSSADTYHYDGSGRTDFGSITKMEAANRAVAGLTDHLGPDDHLGIILFDNQAHVARPLLPMAGVDRDQLKANIMGIFPAGGTYMEGGMRAGASQFGADSGWEWPGRVCGSTSEWCVDSPDQVKCYCPEGVFCDDTPWCLDERDHASCVCTDPQGCPESLDWCFRPGPAHPDSLVVPDDGRANRIIFLTDAMPNLGDTSRYGLLGMIQDNAAKNIHTTFIGMGVDFNTELVEAITKVRGANYYSVHSPDEFNERMVEEFDYMVTPLAYDLTLTLESDGWSVAEVFGSPEADEATGEVMRVNTLFPSAKTDGETRGGLVLLRLGGSCTAMTSDNLQEVLELATICGFDDQCVLDGMVDGCRGPANLTVSYTDGDGVTRTNTAAIDVLDGVDVRVLGDPLVVGGNATYDNDGIRKGVLLSRYVEMMQTWIIHEREQAGGPEIPQWAPGHWERGSLDLVVSPPYDVILREFRDYFVAEAAVLGDPLLDREVGVLNLLVGS